MALSSKQPRWDIYETVILLEGYLETLQGIQSKSQIIKRISADLRRMAVNRGVEIDDVYRNENGVSYQIQSMDSAFKGQKVYVPATKLFTDAVALYRTDNEGYQKILGEAKGMITVKKNSRSFSCMGKICIFRPEMQVVRRKHIENGTVCSCSKDDIRFHI